MVMNLVYVLPIKSTEAEGQWEFQQELDDQEMCDVIERAERVGFTCESSVVKTQPYTDRIRLNDPKGEGFHRDYLARIERT